MNRRQFFIRGSGGALAGWVPGSVAASHRLRSPLRLNMALKFPMFDAPDLSLTDKFCFLNALGFAGVEVVSPPPSAVSSYREASTLSGLPIHGLVHSVPWCISLAGPEDQLQHVKSTWMQALHRTRALGASSFTVAMGPANPSFSSARMRRNALWLVQEVRPLLAELRIHLLLENTGNDFLCTAPGTRAPSPFALADFIDEVDSPLVGVYFDIGNQSRFDAPERWIRALGHRIVKIDLKDWSPLRGFCPPGAGVVSWPRIKTALADMGFQGWATGEGHSGGRDRVIAMSEAMRRCIYEDEE